MTCAPEGMLSVRAHDNPKVEPMSHHSRALRRALAAADARAAVTARRPTVLFSAATAAMVGLALTVGFVSAPAAGAEAADPLADVAAFVSGSEPHARFADEAAVTIASARDAIVVAETLGAEVAASGLDLAGAPVSVETTELAADIDHLDARESMPALLLVAATAGVSEGTEAVVASTTALQTAFVAAQEKKAADDAAQAAAEQAAAEAAALAAANTVDGAKATARQLAASQYGWGEDQFSCLSSLWSKESGWNYQAYNPSGATGIPQALPGSKMASAGSDWQSSAATQIAWGLGYISSVYGSPCSAWSHSQSSNWY